MPHLLEYNHNPKLANMRKSEDKTPEILDAFWAMVDKFQKKWGVDLKINLEEVKFLEDKKIKK